MNVTPERILSHGIIKHPMRVVVDNSVNYMHVTPGIILSEPDKAILQENDLMLNLLKQMAWRSGWLGLLYGSRRIYNVYSRQ